MSSEMILFGILAGIAATVTMDLLSRASRWFGLIVGAEGQWLGRWYLGIIHGQFLHSNIADSAKQAGEKRAAMVGHFAIGITLAVVYVAGAGWLGVSPDSFFAALGYGFATCVFPWFLLFPALGFGFFGLKATPELKLFRSSVFNHLSYGFGLWWTAKVLPLG